MKHLFWMKEFLLIYDVVWRIPAFLLTSSLSNVSRFVGIFWKFENRLRFDRIMVMILRCQIFGPPCIIVSYLLHCRLTAMQQSGMYEVYGNTEEEHGRLFQVHLIYLLLSHVLLVSCITCALGVLLYFPQCTKSAQDKRLRVFLWSISTTYHLIFTPSPFSGAGYCLKNFTEASPN